MTRLDFTPFFRSTIGFDHLENVLDNLERNANAASYPPYNIEKFDENAYRISMAVAGFTLEDIDITAQQNTLVVRGDKESRGESNGNNYLHRGIATRNFEQHFKLADYVEVKSAHLENGMLHIDLVREIPEKMKPRKIEIKSEGMFEKVKKLTKSDKKAA